jgi:hypothetical protein
MQNKTIQYIIIVGQITFETRVDKFMILKFSFTIDH